MPLTVALSPEGLELGWYRPADASFPISDFLAGNRRIQGGRSAESASLISIHKLRPKFGHPRRCRTRIGEAKSDEEHSGKISHSRDFAARFGSPSGCCVYQGYLGLAVVLKIPGATISSVGKLEPVSALGVSQCRRGRLMESFAPATGCSPLSGACIRVP